MPTVVGLALLRERGVTLLTADGHNLTDDTDEMQEAMLSVMAVFATMEKKRLVKKLKAARDRKSAKQGKRIEGRKGYQETNPELVKAAKSLAHGNTKGEKLDDDERDALLRQPLGIGRKKLSLRAISTILAEQGYTTGTGKPFSAEQVKRLLAA